MIDRSELPERKRNRLRNFDYSLPGAYFVTICTENRRSTLCRIVGDGFPVPKRPGRIAAEWIERISEKFPGIRICNYVVMPNHIHLLLSIDHIGGTGDPSPTLGNVIGWYKYSVTKQVNTELARQGRHFFQRSFHDHVIRSERDFAKIWNYIEGNPQRWADDCFYTAEADGE